MRASPRMSISRTPPISNLRIWIAGNAMARRARAIRWAALDQCSGCQAQPMATPAQEKRFIDGYVTPNREIPWQVYARQPENVYFSHAAHIKLAHLDCRQCRCASLI